MPDYKEVTINIDWETKIASIWCAPSTCEKKLRRLGFTEKGRQAGGYWFEGTAKSISFRSLGSNKAKPRKEATPEAKAARAAGLAAYREARRAAKAAATGESNG